MLVGNNSRLSDFRISIWGSLNVTLCLGANLSFFFRWLQSSHSL